MEENKLKTQYTITLSEDNMQLLSQIIDKEIATLRKQIDKKEKKQITHHNAPKVTEDEKIYLLYCRCLRLAIQGSLISNEIID
jgi:hypothetical protein